MIVTFTSCFMNHNSLASPLSSQPLQARLSGIVCVVIGEHALTAFLLHRSRQSRMCSSAFELTCHAFCDVSSGTGFLTVAGLCIWVFRDTLGAPPFERSLLRYEYAAVRHPLNALLQPHCWV